MHRISSGECCPVVGGLDTRPKGTGCLVSPGTAPLPQSTGHHSPLSSPTHKTYMRKVLANLVPYENPSPHDPPGVITRVSATHTHFKKILAARGNDIWTHPCPEHSSETYTFPMTWLVELPDGKVEDRGVVRTDLFCWTPQPQIIRPAPPVGEVVQAYRGNKLVTKQIRFGSVIRNVMQPKSVAFPSLQKTYVNFCRAGVHCPRLVPVEIFTSRSKKMAIKYGWIWLSDQTGEACPICYQVLEITSTGSLKAPPWAKK